MKLLNQCVQFNFLAMVTVAIMLAGCVSAPVGKAKVELIDRLVTEHEFEKIRLLLSNIDTKDPEFESLVVRRRAIRPLIAQYEQYTINRVAVFQGQDLWPQALSVLRDAQTKLPNSQALEEAEDNFFVARAERIEDIQQQIGLLEGKSQSEKTPLVDKIVDIHPKGIRTRWQQFQNELRNKELAGELLECGDRAITKQELDLAEACYSMASTLAENINVTSQLAGISAERQRIKEHAAELARVEADRRRQQRDRDVAVLKEQYRQLSAAGWLAAAKQSLAQLRTLVPADEEAKQWALELQLAIDEQVREGIRRGQALYSNGKLEEALNTWQDAATLDPENPVLQGHIARAERFLQKLERLNGGKS